jgi:FkbM family methyltransferase
MSAGDCIAQFMNRWIQRGDCVLDVGANQGLYAMKMAELVGQHGQLHAFEPNPELAGKLKLRGAGHPLTVVEKGVSERVGMAEFYLDVRESVGAVASSMETLVDMHANGNVRPIAISLTTLDGYCREHGLSPQFIKIDVEGHERSVFRGATETINRCRPFLVFEFWETWWDLGVRDIFAFLKEHYALIRLQDGALVNDEYDQVRRVHSVDIGCIPIHRAMPHAMRPELLQGAGAAAVLAH